MTARCSQAVTQPALQDTEILYNGQHVAIVVAETLERAQAAAAAVKLRYHEGEAQTTMAGALDQAYVPKNFRNGQRKPDSSRGDPCRQRSSRPRCGSRPPTPPRSSIITRWSRMPPSLPGTVTS